LFSFIPSAQGKTKTGHGTLFHDIQIFLYGQDLADQNQESVREDSSLLEKVKSSFSF
jgi:hypothetical protein